MREQETIEVKNAQLWEEAKTRADFKTHLTIYLIINSGLWLLWLVTGGVHSYPWPVWPSIGWGIGLVANYFSVYHFSHTAEKEYKKLKKEQ